MTFSPQLEVSRYNTLIGLVRGALADLAGALKGSIIMSLEIEDTLEAVRKASIPLPWLLQVNLKKEFIFCSFFLDRVTPVIAPSHLTLRISLKEWSSSTNGSRYTLKAVFKKLLLMLHKTLFEPVELGFQARTFKQ